MLAAAVHDNRAELISSIALPLPLTIISELLGIPEPSRQRFRRYMAGLLDVDSGGARLFTALPRIVMLMRLFRELIAERRKTPGNDLVSDLIAAEESGESLNEKELLSMMFLLLLAGHETTVNLIGNGMLALLDNPEQLERLRADPSLIDTAVEELLRYVSPVQFPAPRYVLADVELGGRTLHAGDVLIPLIGSANRDERAFPDGDSLDVGRTPNKHLSFGFAAHYCVGAPLARLEAKHAFLALLRRFPALKLTQKREELPWRRSLALRGVRELHVTL
jgi:cytochrome P450 PksS